MKSGAGRASKSVQSSFRASQLVKKTSNRAESVDCLSELIQSHKAES